MANTTVIDTLIIKLGLDPKDFTAGEKKAAASTVQLENQVNKSTKSMSASMLGFTGKLLGVATAVVAIKKVIDSTSELSANIRTLGQDADNYRLSANELRNWGNIAELNGGKAADATKTIGGLTKAVYDMAYNGSMSDSLIMLSRLGVQFQDTTGNMRDYKDIVLDTQAAVQTSMRHGTSRANAYQMLLQAGFDPGTANAMLQGDVAAQFTAQGKHRALSANDIALNKALQISGTNRSQAIDAAQVGLITATAPAITSANNAIAAGVDATGNASFTGAIETATTAVKEFAATLVDKSAGGFKRGMYDLAVAGASAKYSLPSGMLAGVINTESGFNPDATNPKSGIHGIAQLNPKYFKNAGKNPLADIDTAGGELRRLHDAAVRRGDADDQGAWVLALEDYNAGATSASQMRAGKKPFAEETANYPGKVLSYAAQATPSPNAQSAGAAGRGDTNVTFENVQVNTSSQNGQGIANDFVDGTRRKLQAAQAENGAR